MTSSGLWTHRATDPGYGDSSTYRLGAEWLAGLDVEDWGCGGGAFKNYLVGGGKYLGIDGSPSPAASIVGDLLGRHSKTPGLFVRHVLEHNRLWREILKNALESFERRMALVVFTPFHMVSGADRILTPPWAPIPDLALSYPDLFNLLQRWLVREESVATKSVHGSETVFYLEKGSPAP